MKDKQKLKILIFSHILDRSGAPTSLLYILKYLYEKGYKVDVISKKGGELIDEYRKYSNSLHILDYDSLHKKGCKVVFSRFFNFFRLITMLKKISPDVVLINTSVNLRAHLACYIMKIPFIVYVRESENMLKSKLGYFRKITLNFADKIICVSKYSSIWVSKYVNPNKIYIVHNGIKAVDFEYSIQVDVDKDYFKICIIGYMSKRKGIDYFAQIINKLMNISKNYKFFIIGDFVNKDEKELFFNLVKNYKDNIFISGIVDNVYSEINKCDIVVMTSREESLPRSVMEASMMAKPVVAFDIGGTKEMLPSNYEYLVPPFDTEKFVAKILQLSNKNKIKEIGERNRKYIIENFPLEKTLSEVEKILNDTSR